MRGVTRRSASVAVAIALVSLLSVFSVAGAAARQKASFHCQAGYKVVAKVVRRHGASKTLLRCVRKEGEAPPVATAPATVSTPASDVARGTSGPTTPAPEPVASAPAPDSAVTVPPAQTVIPAPAEAGPEPPTSEESSGPQEGLTVHAYLYPGFAQNPSAPDEVTWRYSASATQTTTEEEVEKTELASLPTGVLVFYVDGHLECETHVGGHIASDTCTVDLGSLGSHEVEVIYSAGALWSTKGRTDTIAKYPTSIDLEAVSEPVPPRKRTLISGGYSYRRTEVGQLRVTKVGAPVGYPEFDCEGQPKGCVIPMEGTVRRDGSVYFPLYAGSEINPLTRETEWFAGVKVYEPIREREETVWQPTRFGEGQAFFHVVSEPSPRYYLPSSATVPLDLTNVHFPFYRSIEGNAGGPVEALESPMTRVLTFGTYDKLGGGNTYLVGELSLGRVWEEPDKSEGCEYEVRIDETVESWRVRSDWKSPHYSAWPYWKGLSAGPHTASLWVGRETGAGPGKCVLAQGSLELYEQYE